MNQLTALSPIVAYHGNVRSDVIACTPKTGGQLLDLGGGTGATALQMRDLGLVERVGVADQIDNSHAHSTLDFAYQANLEDTDLIDRIVVEQGRFQMILALDVLEHLQDPWRVARHLADAIEEGGYLIVSLPNVRNYRALVPLLLQNRWDYKDAGILDRTHLRFFVKSTAVELVEQTGLDVETVTASPCGGPKIAWLRRLTLGLANSFTDQQYIIVARKTGIDEKRA